MSDHGHHDHAGHDHSHGHGHDHAAELAGAGQVRLGWAAAITGAFMVLEIGGGLAAGSLALIADAGHMFTDFGALALAWFAARLGQRPADWKRTYGFDRFAVLVAFVNGLALFVVAALIVWGAIGRLMTPEPVAGPLMLGIAAAGLVANIVVFFVLHGANRQSLNVRGAMLHVLGDLLGSAAAIVAALVIIATGWTPADPILSVLVSLIILRSGWQVVRDAGLILLEAAPREIDSRDIGADLMASVAGVEDVHHVHTWSISEARKVATLHARIKEQAQSDPVVAAIKDRLNDNFGIGHVTVEVERGACADGDDDADCADAAAPAATGHHHGHAHP